MKKIFIILSKYSLGILFALFFIVIQAFVDLELPEYTSDIVNVGIQQGGIENSTPNIIRESEFNKVLLYLNETDKDYILDNYTLEYKNENMVYSLKTVTNEEKEKIGNMLITPIVINYMVNKTNMPINEENLASLKDQFKNNESLMKQSAIEYIKNEYKELKVDVDSIQIDYIINKGLKMVLIASIAMIATIITSYLTSKIAAYFSYDLRNKVLEKIMSYSNKEFNEIGVSSLITRSTNDITQIQNLIITILRIVVMAPIIGLGAYAKLAHSEMNWVIGIVVLILLCLVGVLFTIVLPKFNKVQKMIDKINSAAREILTGLPVIRAFSNEKYEEKRFEGENKNLLKINLFVNKVMAIMMPTMTFIMNAACILIIWIGASKVDAGVVQIGSLIALITYTIQIIISFLMISIVSIMLPRAIISFKRVGEILNKDSSIKEPTKPLKFKENSEYSIEFKNVYFRYPDAEEDILNDINFKCKKGTVTAIIGSTGCGKSTLINLLPRFFDVTGGKILVDGIDIKNASLKELRSKIGFVPQKGNLFSGTIRENISFGKSKMKDKDIINSAKISESAEFINKLDEKYNSHIAQGGTNVSGGQRQRLSIARAIAINPEIYIFDDSFSALDYKTDKKLRKALKEYTKASTILIVAQRISTIMDADQIVVLDKGKIVGIGSHKELYKTSAVYKEIALSQYGEEELS